MNQNETVITELIIRQLQGKSSAAEDEILENWLNENPSNQKLMMEYQKIWGKTGEIEVDEFQPDVDKAWSKVAAKANLHDTPIKSLKVEDQNTSQLWFTKIAAAFILLAGIGYLAISVLLNKDDTQFIEILAQTENREIVLPDGSEVSLKKSGKLIYPEEFKGTQRFIELEGEAFFEVKKDSMKPFVIHGLLSETKVLGTSFYIYTDGEQEKIDVYTGKVSFSSLHTGEKVILTPGKSASVNQEGKLMTNRLSENELSWKTHKLVFDDTSLEEVSQDLSNYFGKKIQLKGDIGKNRFTGTFQNPQINQVLQVVSISTDTEFSVQDSVYILSEVSQP